LPVCYRKAAIESQRGKHRVSPVGGSVQQFQSDDIARVCSTLDCSRAQLAAKLGVSRACVSQWEKGVRAPQRGHAAQLRAWLGTDASVVDVQNLRLKLGMTQRVFGAQFGVSRQQVQKWESGKAAPHRTQLDKLVKLAAATAATRAPLSVVEADMLTVSAAATFSGITEKTIRKALKDGRLPYTIDTSPGPWPKQGRYLIRRADVDAFKANGYDPYFKKGRFKGTSVEVTGSGSGVVAFPNR
jgi:DNA-binding transcriptional regulator YiaG